ncbi:MAG: hypothetical protein ACJZ8S_02740 [Paracoccaceae bacterium]|nr:MAG: hypothetical protein DBW70_05135 [Alphaproteobacteria bacterium]|tara:strand:+ start:2776 stop:3192 length:417 start_codon:yes stop_codon:yes gene_type:complete
MRSKELYFILACVLTITLGGFFLLPKVVKEFQDEEVIRVRITLENRCTITDEAFVVLDESTKIKTPFYGKVAVLRTERNAPLRLWMSPNFPQFRYDGEIQRAKEEMVMISDCNRNPRMDSIMKSMREAFSSSDSEKEE